MTTIHVDSLPTVILEREKGLRLDPFAISTLGTPPMKEDLFIGVVVDRVHYDISLADPIRLVPDSCLGDFETIVDVDVLISWLRRHTSDDPFRVNILTASVMGLAHQWL
jgi:hypothetical protein